MDLVVLNLAHPPGAKPLDRLSSGFSQLLRRCPCPVLTIPQGAGKISRALLAYDDSPASREALFITAYLVHQWQLPLTVVTVNEKERKENAPISARKYLEEKNITADYIEKQGDAAGEILHTAAASASDLLIMGNYGAAPFLSIALGSTVDDVLRAFGGLVLVCR
jgi:nucleotide-binding universal stress UspA family protein